MTLDKNLEGGIISRQGVSGGGMPGAIDMGKVIEQQMRATISAAMREAVLEAMKKNFEAPQLNLMKVNSITKEQLEEMVSQLNAPNFDDEVLDQAMEKGNRIENLLLVTPDPAIKDIKFFSTKYGKLRVSYNPILPKGQIYLIGVDYGRDL